MENLKYKGLLGTAEYSVEDKVWHGKIVGIKDSFSYEAPEEDALEASFQEAVNDYLDTIEKIRT